MTGRSRINLIELQLDTINPVLIGGNGATGTIKLGVNNAAISDIADAADVFKTLAISQPSRGSKAPSDAPDTGFPLRLGEAVLWRSKPTFASFVCSESLLIVVYVAVALSTPYLYNAIHNTHDWVPTWPIIGAVLAVAAIVSPVFMSWRATNTDYFVTSHRVVITRKFSATSRRVTYREWPETLNMRLLSRMGGGGTIVFEKHYGYRKSMDEFTFIAIPDASTVFALVQQTRTTPAPPPGFGS